MEKLTELICHIEAILNYCKDLHYNNTSYQDHLLADRVAEGIDVQDDIKEQMILADGKLPLPSYEYLKGALAIIPDLTGDNKGNWLNLLNLINKTRKLVEKVKADRGGNALIDNLAQALNTSAALLFIQTREQEKAGEEELEESVKTEEGNGKETPVDRKEYKRVLADKEVASKVIDYSNQSAALDESALDRVSKKLGI